MYSIIIFTIFANVLLHGFASARIIKHNKASSGSWATLDKTPPLLMAHRGEKVLMPEHTVGSYEVASIEMADYVEPDLVLTKDGHLVCYHDLTIKSGTNVETFPEFAYLKKNYTGDIDGINKTVEILDDWFIQDFDLVDLKTLHVKQLDRGIRPQFFNSMFQIPTFEEYLDVVHRMSHLQNRSIGVIPELKHPKFHNANRTENYMELTVLSTLNKYGYPIEKSDEPECYYTSNTILSNQLENEKIECGHVIIQSFDIDCLRFLKTKTIVDLLMLADVDYIDLLTYDGLAEVANVSQYFSVWKELLYTGVEAALAAGNIEYDKEHIASLGGFIPPQEIVKEAHKHNLKMGLFTIYDSHEKSNRGCDIECDPEDKEKELFYYFDMGVDGLFVENVQEAMELRMKYDYNLQIEEVRSSVVRLISRSPMQLIFVVLSVIFCSRFN